jgi:ankyrin repeat protein
MIASQLWHLEVTQALLAAGADVSAKTNEGATALMLASMLGHLNIVQALLAAIDAKRGSGILGRARRLLSSNPKINAKSPSGDFIKDCIPFAT